MKQLYKVIKDNKLILDIFNMVLGLSVIALIVLLLIKPNNQYLLFGVLGVNGIMNIINGLRQRMDHNKKRNGLYFVIFGVCSLGAGFLILII